MNGRVTSGWASLLALAFGMSAVAQEPRDISTVNTAVPGAAIAVQPDDPRIDPKELEIPELAGARQAIGSQLIDGRLPRPVIEYATKSPTVTERMTIFETGLVSAQLVTPGGTIQKRMIIPPDALAAYRKELTPPVLARMPHFDVSDSAQWNSLIRIYDPADQPVERRFDSTAVLPRELQQFRMIMQDLLRAICQDREVTNTVTGYTPKIGDRLVSDDQRVFEVISITGEGKFVELRCTSDPTRRYVAVKDLYQQFLGAAPQPQKR